METTKDDNLVWLDSSKLKGEKITVRLLPSKDDKLGKGCFDNHHHVNQQYDTPVDNPIIVSVGSVGSISISGSNTGTTGCSIGPTGAVPGASNPVGVSNVVPDQSLAWLFKELPEYQRHPCTTPDECTCDIMVLMSKGCQCGYIEVEKENKNKKKLRDIW